MDRIGVAFGIGFLLTGACELADIGTEVKYVGPLQTERPFDCRMQMIFGPLPNPHQDIARAKTECPDHLADAELCFDDMRRNACLVGADTVYGIAETREQGVSYLTATFARSLPGPIDAASSGTPARLTCHPICSPGFDCQGETCVPRCNPACGTDQICTPQRLCSPASASRPPGPPQTAEHRREIATVISWGPAQTRQEPGKDVDADVAGAGGTRAPSPPGDREPDSSGGDPLIPESGHD